MMNEFILFLWLVDVASSLEALTVPYWAVYVMVCFFSLAGVSNGDFPKQASDKVIKVGGVIGLCIILFATILPSKQTIYIAACGKYASLCNTTGEWEYAK